MILPPPISTLFPYTTLFRSQLPEVGDDLRVAALLTLSGAAGAQDRKSTRLNSSHVAISYAVFCLKKKKTVREKLPKAQSQIQPRGHRIKSEQHTSELQ